MTQPPVSRIFADFGKALAGVGAALAGEPPRFAFRDFHDNRVTIRVNHVFPAKKGSMDLRVAVTVTTKPSWWDRTVHRKMPESQPRMIVGTSTIWYWHPEFRRVTPAMERWLAAVYTKYKHDLAEAEEAQEAARKRPG